MRNASDSKRHSLNSIKADELPNSSNRRSLTIVSPPQTAKMTKSSGARKQSLSQRVTAVSKEISDVGPQQFKNDRFMKRVKHSKTRISKKKIGFETVKLPSEDTLSLKVVPVVTPAKPETAAKGISSFFNESNCDMSLLKPASTRDTLFLRSASAVLGLCPLKDADALAKQCFTLLRQALGVHASHAKEILKELSNPIRVSKRVRHDMRERRHRLDTARFKNKHDIPNDEDELLKHQFSNVEAFDLWAEKESDEIFEQVKATREFDEDPKAFVAKAQGIDKDDLQENKDTPTTKPWYKNCACCVGDNDDDVTRDKFEHPSRKKKLQEKNSQSTYHQKKRKSIREYAVARSQRNQSDARSIRSNRNTISNTQRRKSERRRRSSTALSKIIDPPSVDDGVVFLSLALLRWLNRITGVNVVVTIGEDDKQIGLEENPSFLWMNSTALFIVDAYCKRFGIGEAQRDLVLLEMFVRYPSISSDYFWGGLDLFQPLLEASNNSTLALGETKTFTRLAALIEQWTTACLYKYHESFGEDIPEKGLAECIRLLRFARENNNSNSSSDEDSISFSQFMDSVCEIALAKRYDYVRELGRKIARQFELQQQNTEDQSLSIMSPKKESVVALDALDEPVESTRHLIYVMQLLQKEMDADIAQFGPIIDLEAGGYKAAAETAEIYFPLILTDFQEFLASKENEIEENRRVKGNSFDAFDSLMFTLYNELVKLYTYFAPHIDLPDIPVGKYFKKIMDQWMEIQKAQFSSTRVDSALKNDKWIMVEDTKCSTSVIDIFSLLYPLAKAFDNAPYSSEHAFQFASLLSDSITYYVQCVSILLQCDIQKAGNSIANEVPVIVLVRLNDIQVCKRKLADLLQDINLEDAYGNAPKLTEHKEETQQTNDDPLDFESNDNKHTLSSDDVSRLRCSASFIFIQDKLEQSASMIADKMNDTWQIVITDLLTTDINENKSDDDVENALQPMWNDLSPKIESMYKMMIDCRFMLNALLSWIVVDFESHMLPQSNETALNRLQLQRARTAMMLILEFFKYYQLPDSYIDKIRSIVRIRYLQDLLEESTSSLATVFTSLPESETITEQERVSSAPYISRLYLRRVIGHRELAGEEEAAEFLRAHPDPNAGWFS